MKNTTIPTHIILFILVLVLLPFSSALSQIYDIDGNVSMDSSPVKYALLTFIDESDTNNTYSTITDSLGNYYLSMITSVENEESAIPQNIQLGQNYPNPFSTQTTIPYKLNKPLEVSVKVYDILGQEVKSFPVELKQIGIHGVMWDGTNNLGNKVTPGVYLYQLFSGKERLVKKMVYGLGVNNLGLTSINTIESLNKKADITKKTLLAGESYIVRIENTDSTSPPIETKQVSNIIIRSDIINLSFKVNEADDFSLCYQKPIGNLEIFLNNIKGTHPKNITNYWWEDRSQTWSPDGNYIAFERIGTPTYVCLYDTKKDTVIYLTAGPDGVGAGGPIWTSDGKHITYNGYWNTYMVNPDGSNNRKLQHTPEFFYSDSYNFLYLANYDSIYLSNIDGTINEFVLDTKTIGENYVGARDFDPYNHKILILADPTTRITDLLVTYDVDSKKIDTISVAGDGWIYTHSKFSSDYSKVAVIKYNYVERIQKLCILEHGKETEFVTIINAGVNSGEESFSFTQMAFSPDDKYLAYSKSFYKENGVWDDQLYVIEIETKIIAYVDMGSGAIWNPQREH